MTTLKRGAGLAAAAVLGLLLAGCGTSATPVPRPSAATAAAGPATPTCRTTADDLRSYAPSASESGPTIAKIKERGSLRIGVSWDTLLMSARKAQNNRVVGFDIDLARAIAKALHVKADFHVITAAARIPDLQQGKLDMVVRAFTINCTRWQQIAFSSEYYDASQKVLVRKDAAPDYQGPQSLAGERVCAPAGTTSLDNIRRIEPKAIPVIGSTHTDCLRKFQQGDVDAITSDDTVLAGLVAQDPYAVVPPQQPLEDEPYGVGMNQNAKDLVAFVNHVIAQYEADGSWERSYRQWLEPALRVGAQPPTPRYGRS